MASLHGTDEHLRRDGSTVDTADNGNRALARLEERRYEGVPQQENVALHAKYGRVQAGFCNS